MTKPVVYTITNIENGKVYVGSTINFVGRRYNHRWELRRGTHGNPYLQHAWDKYGETAFKFIICEYVEDSKQLIDREQYWLDFHRMYVDVYNIALVVDRSVFSNEARRKISESKIGKKRSEETKRKISITKTGVSAGMLGKTHTEEARRNMSRAAKNRPPMTEETKRKIGKSNKAYWVRRRATEE